MNAQSGAMTTFAGVYTGENVYIIQLITETHAKQTSLLKQCRRVLPPVKMTLVIILPKIIFPAVMTVLSTRLRSTDC